MRGARPAFADLMLRPASASATCGGGGCYKGRRRLLQRVSRSRLLLVAAAVATVAVNVCYKGRRRLLLVAAADATSAAEAATKGAAVCYKGRRQLLLVAVADATIDGKGAANLYKRRRQLLQTPVAVATNRVPSCCKETGEACAVLPGRRRSLKPRMAAVLPEWAAMVSEQAALPDRTALLPELAAVLPKRLLPEGAAVLRESQWFYRRDSTWSACCGSEKEEILFFRGCVSIFLSMRER